MAILADTKVSTEVTAAYTVPYEKTSIMQSFVVTNDSKSEIAFSLWLVQGGSQPTQQNSLYVDQPIAAGDKLDYSGAQVLGNALQIQTQGSADGLSIVINGVENVTLPL